MKIIHFFIGIIVFFIGIGHIFADINISINSSDTSVDISELIEIRVDIRSDEQLTGELRIPGFEDFVVVSQSSSQSSTIINGEKTENLIFIFNIKGKKAGNYSIGPITLNNFNSNSVDIEVTGAEVFIGGQIDRPSSFIEEGDDEESKEILEDLEETFSGADVSDFKDIATLAYLDAIPQGANLRDIMKNTQLFPMSYGKTLLYVLFLIGLYLNYLILRFVFKKRPASNKVLRTQKQEVRQASDYQDLLSQIAHKHLHASKDLFYGELTSVFRLYLDEKISAELSTQTLSQIRKKLQSYPSLFRLYEQVYYPEYNTQTDDTEQREQLIHELQNELI